MDPATIAMLTAFLGQAIGGLTSEGGLFGGKGERSSTYNPQQLSTLDQVLESVRGMRGNQDITQNPTYQGGQQWLQGLFNDPQFFQQFEAPLMRQFNEETVPNLANRFASMGSGGSLGSSAFRNQLAREGSNLSTNLAALRGGLQQQGVNQALGYAQQPTSNYLGLLQTGLQPTQNVYQPPSGGALGPLLAALTGGAAQGFGQKWGQSMGGGLS